MQPALEPQGISDPIFRDLLVHQLRERPHKVIAAAVAFMKDPDLHRRNHGMTLQATIDLVLPWLQLETNAAAVVVLPEAAALRRWLEAQKALAALPLESLLTMDHAPVMGRDRILELIAAACHQQNKAWCEAHGDLTHVDWKDASPDLRASAQDGVLRALNGEGPEQLHASWCKFKQLAGWNYGPMKDTERKTHPCLVPWDELPEIQRKKDDLFFSMVRQLAAVLGPT